jgi:carboxylesterase type B
MQFLYYIFLMTFVLISSREQLIDCSHLMPCIHQHQHQDAYILNTKNGRIRGNCQFIATTDAGNKTRATNVYSWLSVPFAEPPKRFEEPKEKQSWGDRVLDGTQYAKTCYKKLDQSVSDSKKIFAGHRMWIPSVNHTEPSDDCLYLNIWLPTSVYRNLTTNVGQRGSASAPIMVFIHGSSGTTALDIYNPSVFVATTGIIVVQITYRSGMFGFFTLGDELNGNQALLDQHMALKWINDNAEYFGGDKHRITLNGVSYGAMTASYHLLYKPSWPLFRNLILQAGSIFNPNVVPIASKQLATVQNRNLLISIGCGGPSTSNADLLKCAQQLEPQTLVQQSSQYFMKLTGNNIFAGHSQTMFFRPVIDHSLLMESFEDAIRSKNVKKCPIITGFTTDEGKWCFPRPRHFLREFFFHSHCHLFARKCLFSRYCRL